MRCGVGCDVLHAEEETPRSGACRLKHEGWGQEAVSGFRLEGLQLCQGGVSALPRSAAALQRSPGRTWSKDLVDDQMKGGRESRILAVTDQRSRERVSVEASGGPKGRRASVRPGRSPARLPRAITVESGSEFNPGARRDRRGASFNGRLRNEFPIVNAFGTMHRAAPSARRRPRCITRSSRRRTTPRSCRRSAPAASA